jgi:hypothetical protein
LRYPHHYISIIEEHAQKLLSELTKQMDKNVVEDTTSATKSAILKNFIEDLLAEA